MPKIYKYLGFAISFFSNDHLPIHVHVSRGGREIKAELHYINGKLEIIYKKTNKPRLEDDEISEVEPFLKKYDAGIRAKWEEFFVLNKTPKLEEVKRKVK